MKAGTTRLRLAREFAARFNPQTEEMSPGFWPIRGRPIVAAPPTKQAGALVNPLIAGDHLGDAREVKTEQAEGEADRVIDQIIVQRQELALEQSEVEETHGKAQRKHIKREMPPWTPGRSDRPASEPGGAPAHDDAYQEKDAERVLVGEKFRDREVHQCLPPSR